MQNGVNGIKNKEDSGKCGAGLLEKKGEGPGASLRAGKRKFPLGGKGKNA